MPEFLGIDTSNYTTSAAVYVSEENRIYQFKKLLPVKDGQLGLRQSDAVFHHTKQLPEIIKKLYSENSLEKPAVVSASVRPRNISGSYM
ncbi:MAG: peptidase M22, partial [Ruminococcus sp.]|nr:peptidase M22 [Ruminococcus sp.]